MIDERGETNSGRAAGERDEQTFGDKLADEPPPASPNCEAYRDFLPSLGGASQEEISEINAGEQQHERADHKQNGGEAEDRITNFRQEQSWLHEEEPAP